jgi:membrane protease YdiL (CAAX protease family)
MTPETSELTRLLFQTSAGLILVLGVAADLFLVYLRQTRQPFPALPVKRRVADTPFSALHVQLAMGVTLLFALAAAFQTQVSQEVPQKDSGIIAGCLIYAVMLLAVVGLCLFLARVSFRRAFLAPGRQTWGAVKLGLLYGAAAIPPVAGLSIALTAALEWAGYPAQPQDVFEWLDTTHGVGTRLFVGVMVVVVAPVAEELLFRGILFAAALKARTFVSAALLTGIYFALVHLHAPSFFPLLALGVAFAAGYAATGSIVTPITMHALFNLTSTLFYLAAPPCT